MLQCTFQLLQYKKWGKPGTCLKWPKFAELTGNASHLLEATERRVEGGGGLGMKQVSSGVLHCVAVTAEQYLTTTILMHTSST